MIYSNPVKMRHWPQGRFADKVLQAVRGRATQFGLSGGGILPAEPPPFIRWKSMIYVIAKRDFRLAYPIL